WSPKGSSALKAPMRRDLPAASTIAAISPTAKVNHKVTQPQRIGLGRARERTHLCVRFASILLADWLICRGGLVPPHSWLSAGRVEPCPTIIPAELSAHIP